MQEAFFFPCCYTGFSRRTSSSSSHCTGSCMMHSGRQEARNEPRDRRLSHSTGIYRLLQSPELQGKDRSRARNPFSFVVSMTWNQRSLFSRGARSHQLRGSGWSIKDAPEGQFQVASFAFLHGWVHHCTARRPGTHPGGPRRTEGSEMYTRGPSAPDPVSTGAADGGVDPSATAGSGFFAASASAGVGFAAGSGAAVGSGVDDFEAGGLGFVPAPSAS